jgi:hypothetical protein
MGTSFNEALKDDKLQSEDERREKMESEDVKVVSSTVTDAPSESGAEKPLPGRWCDRSLVTFICVLFCVPS